MNGRDHNGAPSYPIPVWNGIFDHRPKIDTAIWEFLWCIDRVTREESGVGFVLGGTTVTAGRIAQELHVSEHTVRRHLKRLADHGYLALKLDSYGFVITVANSCKFGIWRSATNGRPVGQKWPTSGTKMADLSDKNGRPNKEDTAVDSAVDTAVDLPQNRSCETCGGSGWGKKHSEINGWRDAPCLNCNPDGKDRLETQALGATA